MDDKSEPAIAPVKSWLAMPMETLARQAIERVRRALDVAYVAVMPDVHLAGDVCVGTAMATRRLIYPGAVGGDIGCGMLAVAFDAPTDLLQDARNAGLLLRALGERVPFQRRSRQHALPLPGQISPADLSHRSLSSIAQDEGRLQLGTLGGGNHFIEMQADEDNRLWLMIHSGSRAMGQAVKSHHASRASIRSAGMLTLDAELDEGRAYLHDQEWARRYADANRQAMRDQVIEILHMQFGIEPAQLSEIRCDHNHVQREEHFEDALFVHRKGAMLAEPGMAGVVPGSMGTFSFHVEGRGCPESLSSGAHGAGRVMARSAARERFSQSDLRQQMQGVWFDPRRTGSLREECPKSYKDVRSVMRTQQELVKTTRRLRPILVYKG